MNLLCQNAATRLSLSGHMPDKEEARPAGQGITGWLWSREGRREGTPRDSFLRPMVDLQGARARLGFDSTKAAMQLEEEFDENRWESQEAIKYGGERLLPPWGLSVLLVPAALLLPKTSSELVKASSDLVKASSESIAGLGLLARQDESSLFASPNQAASFAGHSTPKGFMDLKPLRLCDAVQPSCSECPC